MLVNSFGWLLAIKICSKRRQNLDQSDVTGTSNFLLGLEKRLEERLEIVGACEIIKPGEQRLRILAAFIHLPLCPQNKVEENFPFKVS